MFCILFGVVSAISSIFHPSFLSLSESSNKHESIIRYFLFGWARYDSGSAVMSQNLKNFWQRVSLPISETNYTFAKQVSLNQTFKVFLRFLPISKGILC